MPNFIERWLLRRTSSVAPKARTTFGSDATTTLLRQTIPACSSCRGSLDGHSYRYFACHPVTPADARDEGPVNFLQAIQAEDWAILHASQKPALDELLFVLYAIACPRPPAGSGMVALLLTQPDLLIPDTLFFHLALTPESVTSLRANCPTCQWIPFTPPLQLQQDTV